MSTDKIKKELKELLKEPDNRYCADCPIKGPTWASVNLGVWICMPCSGIHRSLGTHITQVRSVDLDKWKPEWVEVMKTWGNAKANVVWEAKMPKGYDGRPNETEAQELTQKLQKFIRDKYERKKWYSETGGKKSEGKKTASDEDEDENDDDDDDDEDEKEIRPKLKISSSKHVAATSTAKKPVVVMKSTPSSVPAIKAAVKAPETLIESFDPFGDSSSFEPTFPSAPIAAATSTSQGSPGFGAFSSAAATPAAAPPKPALDLNSLYGMSSQSTQPQMGGWASTPTFPPMGQPVQPTFSFPPMGQPQYPSFPQQQQQHQYQAPPIHQHQGYPAQQQQQQQFMPQQPIFPPQQQQGGYPMMYAQQPASFAQAPNMPGAWPGTMPQPQQQSRPAAGSASDPFSGLLG